jgi:hypothetical protein
MDICGRSRSFSSWTSGTSCDERPRGEAAEDEGIVDAAAGDPGGEEKVLFIVLDLLEVLEPYLRGGAKSREDSVIESLRAEGVGRAVCCSSKYSCWFGSTYDATTRFGRLRLLGANIIGESVSPIL